MMRERLILHIDINSFYAQVELLSHPELKDLPVAVGGDQKQRHGVVLAKNEPAKQYDVRTGESLFEARRKCPNLIVLPPHHDQYLQFSQQAMKIYYKYSERVESFGLDECWLDCSDRLDSESDWNRAAYQVADEIREDIRQNLNLTVSIGVSWNKSFAKLGSDYRKPDAVTVIGPGIYRKLVWPLPVGRLLYVGPVSEKRLADAGILTIGQLAGTNDSFLISILGKSGSGIARMARGEDDSPVLAESDQKPRQSVGSIKTLSEDLKSLEDAKLPLRELAEEVSQRLMEKNLRGQTIHIAIRDNLFHDKSRQRQIHSPISSTDDIYEQAFFLLEANEDFRLPIRALGISVSSLIRSGDFWQPSLFDMIADPNDETLQEAGRLTKENGRVRKSEALELALRKLRERYGSTAVGFGDELFPDDN